jgi:hypothetical protein
MIRSPLVKLKKNISTEEVSRSKYEVSSRLKKKSVNIHPEEEKWDDNGNEEEGLDGVYDGFLSDWVDEPAELDLPLNLPVASERWCDICEEESADTVYRLTPNVNICGGCLSWGTP